VLLGMIAISILIAVPILVLTDRFQIGVLVIFLGSTLFYSYYGLARGFMASKRLLAAYLGSNLVQIIAIIVVYQFGSTDSPTPALLIYGLSYLLPVIVLILLLGILPNLVMERTQKAVEFVAERYTTFTPKGAP